MYHYTECGLDNVWLANGYRQRGDAVSIENSEGLHEAILHLLAKWVKYSAEPFVFTKGQDGLWCVALPKK